MELHVEHALESLRRLLPLTRVFVDGDAEEMRYRFNTVKSAQYWEQVACSMIIANKLPLVVDVEIWQSRGVVHEVSLVVKYAPKFEELMCY